MKRLSERAFTMLLSKYGDGPTLSSGDHCIHCPSDGVKTMIRADDCMDRRSPFKEIVDASPAGKTLKGTLYYVSRNWLLQWSLRRNVNFPSEADIGPTTSIRCPHGELVPEQAAGAKRVLIPEDLCLFLYEQSNKLKPEDPLACSTFPSDAETCGICSVELNNAKLKERQNHNKLLQGNNDSLSPGSKYYLVPSWWLSKWKSYITASGKMVSSPAAARPDPLEGVIDSLVCSKHSRLLERPPIVICKRGHIFQKPYTTDGLTLISENDWKFFCEDWQGANSKCVSAEFEFSGADAKKLIGSSEEVPISEAKLNASNDEVEPRQPTIKTYPTICEECIGERERRELMQKSSYCNEEISVVPVRGIEDPRSVLEASWAVSEPDSHTSKCLTNLNGDVLEADNSSPALIDNTSVPCSHGQGAWTTLLFKAHGTTTVGLQHPNFGVVVGADGKTSCIQTLTLGELDQCKINHFGGGGGVDQFKMSGAWAGEVERCEEISAQVHQLVDDATNEADKVKFIRERLMALDGEWGYIFGEIEKKAYYLLLYYVNPIIFIIVAYFCMCLILGWKILSISLFRKAKNVRCWGRILLLWFRDGLCCIGVKFYLRYR
ncbi:ubiquitin carboxyl-terminal hydrolase 26-like isoform X1 [Papaver somniferum]|uniref:ubiquitin carboxyl-terminal hydrolase 26-like isoform X1 n=1 Tax=Papaver somniferum TaxID=3469 RepID=UPI000E70251D|nr:ubiquitin carboxyl-terminal hydrolase 26-like isoform X1 [Papaver somniferum]